MKRKLLLSMALVSAAVMGSTPMMANAACGRPIQIYTGKACGNYAEWDYESLKGVLSGLCGNQGMPNVQCPTRPGCSGSSCLQGPEMPDIEIPDVEVPGGNGGTASDIFQPGTQNPDTQAPGMGNSGSQAGTEAVSYGEQIAALVNAERAKAGLPALTLQTEITNAANVRAREIRQQFSHTRPDGRSFSTVLGENGVSYRGSGENIAYGQRSPEAVMESWMNSAGHRANILNANYKNIGVGYYQDESGVNYWVQLFTY